MSATVDLRGRYLRAFNDFATEEILYLIDLAAELKTARQERREEQTLIGKKIVLIFEQDRARTRCAFEVAARDQGATVSFIEAFGSCLGPEGTVRDTARALGRNYDAIGYRGVSDAVASELTAWAGVPVFTGLDDERHPTQILANFLTFDEHLDKPLDEVAFCYLGGARFNMADIYLVGGARLGMDVRIAGPQSYWPSEEVRELARRTAKLSGGQATVTEDLEEGVAGCDVLLADVWVSPGEPPGTWDERIKLLLPYQVNARTMELADNPDVKLMHCLPALHAGDTTTGKELWEKYGADALEVSDEVLESNASLVFDQAENRMHAIKAVLVATLAD